MTEINYNDFPSESETKKLLNLSYDELISFPESKQRALKLNSAFYFNDKKCVRDHLSVKYTSSGNCLECVIEKRKLCKRNYRGKSTLRNEENQILAMNALEKGYSTYVSVTPCKSCKKQERYVTTNNCVNCNGIRKSYSRLKRIEKIYNLTKDDYENILKKQNNHCAICEIDLHEKNTHIDHCHSKNIVRGLLCSKCNQAIGLLQEKKESFEKAVKYLESTQ